MPSEQSAECWEPEGSRQIPAPSATPWGVMWADSSRQRNDLGWFLFRHAMAEGLSGASVEASLNGRRSLADWADRSVLFERYWRSRPPEFSFEPRCHGECGSRKKIGIRVAAVKLQWRAISLP